MKTQNLYRLARLSLVVTTAVLIGAGAANAQTERRVPQPIDSELLLGVTGALDAAGLNLTVQSVTNGSQLSIAWNANLGIDYKVCWKVANTGDACASGSHELTITPVQGVNWSGGIASVLVQTTQCGGTEYKVKVKRVGSLTNATKTVKTGACPSANRCPAGGWDDGQNCSFGHPPAGTTAFIYGNNYYYTPLAGSNPCPYRPYPDSGYDTANCFVQPVPAGVSPFIWANHWYYKGFP